MQPRRIVVFAAYYQPHKGGYCKNIHELYRRLVLRGYEVDVVTCNTENAVSHEVIDGITVYRLPCWHILGKTYPIPKPSWMLFDVFRRNYDLASTQTRFFVTSLLGLILAKGQGIPLVHTERGSQHSVVSNRFVDWLSRVYDHTLGALVVRLASANMGVSQASCDFVRHLGGRNVYLVPNGIDAKMYSNIGLQSGDAFIIIYVGRLIYAKGVQDLIAALPVIERRVGRIKLVIVGDGNYRAELQIMSQGKPVIFLGEKDARSIAELLSVSDVFVNPSYSEGLPTSVMEAAAAAIPIVATDVGGTRDIVKHLKTGYLVPPHSPNKLADGVCWMIKNGGSLSKNARQYVLDNYSWDSAVIKTELVYQKLDTHTHIMV